MNARTWMMLPTLLLFAATISLPARGQEPVPPPPELPGWVRLVGPLPEGAGVVEASDERLRLTFGEAQMELAWRSGSAGEAAAEALGEIEGRLGGTGEPHYVSVCGRWVRGSLVVGARDGKKGAAVIAARSLAGGRVLAVKVGGPRSDPGLGRAIALLAALRLQGVDDEEPFPSIDLTSRPEARINPVGLFVPLPEGWRPKLNRKERVFRLTRGGFHLVFAKAGTAEQREMASVASMRSAHPDVFVQPLFWRAAGHRVAYQLLRLEGEEVRHVMELHLIRFRKLGDWNYNLVRVETDAPARGLAPARSVLARLKLIP